MPVTSLAAQSVIRSTPNLSMVKSTPFPIIDKAKQNVMEKMIDFIISDGPANRFAMICHSCFGHNGMALQEEFEYTAFKCAFCMTFNPARKIRPKPKSLSPMRRDSSSSMDLTKPTKEDSDSDDSTSSDDAETGIMMSYECLNNNVWLKL